MFFKKFVYTIFKKSRPAKQDALRWFIDASPKEQRDIMTAATKGAIKMQKSVMKACQK